MALGPRNGAAPAHRSIRCLAERCQQERGWQLWDRALLISPSGCSSTFSHDALLMWALPCRWAVHLAFRLTLSTPLPCLAPLLSQAAAEADALLPGLASVAAAPADSPPNAQQPQPQLQQQQQPQQQQHQPQQQDGDAASPGPAGGGTAGDAPPPHAAEEAYVDAVPIPDWLLQENSDVPRGRPDLLVAELRAIGGAPARQAPAGAAPQEGAAGGSASAASGAPGAAPAAPQAEARASDSPPGPPESSISEHTATVLTSSSASAAPAPPPAATSSPEEPAPIPPAQPSSTDPSTESGAPSPPDGGAFELPSGGLPAALAGGGMLRYPWTNVSFQPAGLERAFATNYSRRQQQVGGAPGGGRARGAGPGGLFGVDYPAVP